MNPAFDDVFADNALDHFFTLDVFLELVVVNRANVHANECPQAKPEQNEDNRHVPKSEFPAWRNLRQLAAGGLTIPVG